MVHFAGSGKSQTSKTLGDMSDPHHMPPNTPPPGEAVSGGPLSTHNINVSDVRTFSVTSTLKYHTPDRCTENLAHPVLSSCAFQETSCNTQRGPMFYVYGILCN